MINKYKKQFGVWMDSHVAIIAGRDQSEQQRFYILGQVHNAGAANNSNENTANNHEVTLTQKFFKEIAAKMVNIDEIHVTGTGQIQEQFIRFLGETPQYRNVIAKESTTNRISDELLLEFFEAYFK